MNQFISKEILDELSYCSTLGQSLKQISLNKTPIEIQLWCGKDYRFNVWSHKHIYKYDNAEIGRKMYQLYCENQIETEDDFLKKLEEMRGAING